MAVSTSDDSSEKFEHTNVRVLELFFALFEAPKGLFQPQIQQLAPYTHLTSHAFDVALSRDMDNLRTLGIRIDESRDTRSGQLIKHYQVDRSSVRSAVEDNLTSEQLQLIRSALAALPDVSPVQLEAVEHMLRARSDQGLPRTGVHVDSDLDDAGGLSTIFAAISSRIPISFPYTSSTESAQRSVEAWKIILRGHGLYLWGWDLDRQAPRLFRLSRIEGEVELLGEPGDCDHEQPEDEQPFASLRCEPVLALRQGAVVPFADLLEFIPGDSPDGWVCARGASAEHHVWMDRVIAHVDDVVVLEPATLRDHIMVSLRALGGELNA